MAIDPVVPNGMQGIGKPSELARSQGQQAADGADFKKYLLDNLNKVNEMQIHADQEVENLLTGQETDINKVMGAVEKADVAFQTLMAVRNKLVESYQELLRMRI